MKKTVRFIKIGDLRIKISTINRYYTRPKNGAGYPIVIRFSGTKAADRFYVETEQERNDIITILDSLLLDDRQL